MIMSVFELPTTRIGFLVIRGMEYWRDGVKECRVECFRASTQ
jgi:hypothetical protein